MLKTLIKTHRKVLKSFKPSIHNAVNTGKNFAKYMAFYVPVGCARFAKYCGKMYSRHLFSVQWIDKANLQFDRKSDTLTTIPHVHQHRKGSTRPNLKFDLEQ